MVFRTDLPFSASLVADDVVYPDRPLVDLLFWQRIPTVDDADRTPHAPVPGMIPAFTYC